jgi:hypothetical protein
MQTTPSIQPVGNYLLIQLQPPDEDSANLIVLPEGSSRLLDRWKVLNVGNAVSIPVCSGDSVLIRPDANLMNIGNVQTDPCLADAGVVLGIYK